jgi:hypothetical protein
MYVMLKDTRYSGRGSRHDQPSMATMGNHETLPKQRSASSDTFDKIGKLSD